MNPTTIEALLAHHLTILGMTGTGKTYVARLLVEYELRLERRVVVIDPTGAWWGLKASADGKGPGFPVAVLGGDYGDRPLSPDSGAQLGEILANTNLPCVLDLSEMEADSEQQRFVTAFVNSLYQHSKRVPMRVVIDETDMFAPQQPMPGQRMMLNKVRHLVQRGRKKGLAVTMITQRPAVLSKSVMTQANALIAMRLTGPQDRKAVMDWVGGQMEPTRAKTLEREFPGIPRGYGFAWAPAGDIAEMMPWGQITTFDSGRTPEHGEAVMEPVHLAQVDLSALDSAQDQPELAKSSKSRPSLTSDERERIQEAAYQRGFDAGLLKGRAEGERLGRADAHEAAEIIMRRCLDALAHEATVSRVGVGKVTPLPPEPAPDLDRDGKNEHAAATIQRAPEQPAEIIGQLPKIEGGGIARILRALALAHPGALTKAQVARLVGMSPKGGSFRTYVSRLRSSGIIEGRSTLTITDDTSREHFGQEPPDPGMTLRLWLDALGPNAAGKVLRIVAHAGDRGVTREELAEHGGWTISSGSFRTYLSRVRSAGLLREEGGRFYARAIVFDLSKGAES